MAIDPNQWTQKTREGFIAAQELAKAESHPEVTPDHLLLALVGQADGIVLPILQRLGQEPLAVRNRLTERLGELPKAFGAETQQSRELINAFDAAEIVRNDLGDDYLSTEHLLLALSTRLELDRSEVLEALREVRGSHRVTSQNPEDQYQSLEKYARDLTARPRGQARPGHRARRRDPPGDPGAVAPHQEQPGADRRTRGRQDRHRRGPRAPHRRRRRARALKNKRSVRSTSARWSRAPSTGASSRSASRRCSRRSTTPTARSSRSSTSCTRWWAPGGAEGAMDAGNMLKPMLARGELRMVGATTLDEYRKHIEKDAALERRFQQVLVGEPSVEDTICDPARPEGALRGSPRRAHPGRRARQRGRAVRPLPHRPVPARQGDRPRRRSGLEAAHRDRLGAHGDRRGRAPHPQLEIERVALEKETDARSRRSGSTTSTGARRSHRAARAR